MRYLTLLLLLLLLSSCVEFKSSETKWTSRSGHQVVEKGGEFYLFGGYDASGLKNDVWKSSDVVSWEQVTGSASWKGRSGHQVVLNGDYFYLFGGFDANASSDKDGYYDASSYKNDVWKSSDGASWEQVTGSASWRGRSGHQVVLKGDYFYLFGGFEDKSWRNDVWRSNDGISWTKVTARAKWTARSGHQVVLNGDYFYLFGGNSSHGLKNDVWKSSNGKYWARVMTRAPWTSRYEHQVVLKDGAFYLFDGYDGAPKNDVWKSSNGKSWTLVSRGGAASPTQWSSRYGHQVVVRDGAFYLFGGSDGTPKNDVWSFRLRLRSS